MNTKRLFFLDNLKWFIIWLMVVFHGAMCYMAYAPEWWYVVDKSQPVFSATLFICWVDIFIMPVMFFVSGYFGIMSLSRHNGQKFWQGKLRRIILPWLFGSAFIAPLIAYITLASRQSPMGFGEFYQTLFWGPFYQQANFWYLGALTALYLMLHIIVRLFPALSQQSLPKHPSFLFFALLMGLTVISIYLIGSMMPPDTWHHFAYILVLQPVRIPSYILIFFTGVLAWKWGWFQACGYVPSPKRWALPFLILSVLYLWQKLFLPYSGISAEALAAANGLCQGLFSVTAVFFLLGFFHRYVDFTTPLLTKLSATSYAVYYIHQPILFCTAWAFLTISLNVYMKYLLVCLIALTGCYLVSRYLLMRLPAFSH